MVSESGRSHLGSKGKKEEEGRTCDELLGVVELGMGNIPRGLQET